MDKMVRTKWLGINRQSINPAPTDNMIFHQSRFDLDPFRFHLSVDHLFLELDRYIGNTHHRGRLWDHRNHRQMMTIGNQSVPMFHGDVTHRIPIVMGSIGHSCSTIQGSARYLSLMTVQAPREVSVFDICSSAEGGICL